MGEEVDANEAFGVCSPIVVDGVYIILFTIGPPTSPGVCITLV